MSTTDERPYAGAFREWWLRRSFYAKNFLILDAIALFVLMIALVATAAGSSDSTSTTYSGSSPSSSYSSTSSYSPSDYISDVRSHVSAPAFSDAVLLTFGHSAVRAEARGEGGNWATQMVRTGTMDAYSANYVRESANTYLVR